MKKILLGLGTIASVAAPIAAVVACNDSDDKAVNVNLGTKVFTNSNSATTVELTKGLGDPADPASLAKYAPLSTGDIGLNHPVGPNSGIAHNYSGAIGITVATDKLADKTETEFRANVQALLKALLLDKTILTNNNTQNLNTEKFALIVYETIKKIGVKAFKVDITTPTDLGLKFMAGANKGKEVQFTISGSTVAFVAK